MINLKHKDTGQVKQVKLGFSWTTFFFGFLVPLFRGDVKWFLIMLLLDVVTAKLASFVVMDFMYNKIYINGLLEKGYIPADDNSANALKNKGILGA